VKTYGTSSLRVVEMGGDVKGKSLNERLHPRFPYLKSEVVFAVREEMALKPNDILCRRLPLAFIDE
jgi:glycerol-3-phosphate dehydrogenase